MTEYTSADVRDMLIDAIRCIDERKPVSVNEYVITAMNMIDDGALRA